MRTLKTLIILFAIMVGVASCETNEEEISSIKWGDGDSGFIDGVKFRLANADAPETGPIGSRNGAKCENELRQGRKAKAYMKKLSAKQTITITRKYGRDRYDRETVSLNANGVDIVKTAIKAGHLKSWPHINGKAQTRKPDWCN